MSARTVASAGLLVGLFGGAVAAGTLWQADSRPAAAATDGPPGVRQFLRTAQATCPQVARSSDAVVVAASVPDQPGQTDPGTATVSRKPDRDPIAQVDQPGASAVADHLTKDSFPVVSAEGGLAPGLATGRLSDDRGGQGKGLASSACLQPAAETWLLGGTAGPGQRDTLYLVNPTATDSIVDVSAFGKGGSLDLTGDEGIAVPAHSTRSMKLSALAPRIDDMAVRVRTSVGLIAAVVAADRMDGLTPMGTDIITDAGSPQRSVLLGAVPAGAGTRELQLLAPEGTGSVTVTAVTPDGEQPLLAGQGVPVKANHLVVLDVTKDLAGQPAALRVDSDVPVVATVSAATAVDETLKQQREAAVAKAEAALKSATGKAERAQAQATLAKADTANAISPGEDLALFGAAPPISGTAAVTALRSDLDGALYLTGTGGAASVDVSILPAKPDGAALTKTQRVEVPDARTVVVTLKAPGGAATYTAVMSRVSGPGEVHVSNVQSDQGRSLTGYSLAPLAIWVPLPAAQPDYAG